MQEAGAADPFEPAALSGRGYDQFVARWATVSGSSSRPSDAAVWCPPGRWPKFLERPPSGGQRARRSLAGSRPC